jgi:hypothetical protein
MKIHRYNNLIILSVLLASLSACDISPPDDTPQITTTTINGFDVIGRVTGDATIEMPMRLDNGWSDTGFDLDWDVVSSDPFSVEVYISTDNVLDDTDGLFLETQCGSNKALYACTQQIGIPCGFAYQPVYEMVQAVDENDNKIFDENGDPVMEPAVDEATGNFIVAVDGDRYYLRCADGPPTVRELEITDRVPLPHGYPLVPFSSYFIFKACAYEEQSCPNVPVLVQFLNSQL